MIITPTFFLTSWGKKCNRIYDAQRHVIALPLEENQGMFSELAKNGGDTIVFEELAETTGGGGREEREGERGEEGRKEKGRGGVCTWWSEVGSREDKRDNTRGNETTENT